MHVYELEQVSMSNGELTDFNLPKLGLFSTHEKAIKARDAHIQQKSLLEDTDYHTTSEDYRINRIEVN